MLKICIGWQRSVQTEQKNYSQNLKKSHLEHLQSDPVVTNCKIIKNVTVDSLGIFSGRRKKRSFSAYVATVIVKATNNSRLMVV